MVAAPSMGNAIETRLAAFLYLVRYFADPSQRCKVDSIYEGLAEPMLHPISWSVALPYYLAALFFGYLLGSIPFGLIFTRLAGTADIRALGSGNIGATNVLRTGRRGLAAATLLADIFKGTAAVLFMYWLWGIDHAILAALGAFLGHLFAVWLAVAAIARYSSLAALFACAATPAVLWLTDDRQEAQLFVLLTVLVVIMHRGNI